MTTLAPSPLAARVARARTCPAKVTPATPATAPRRAARARAAAPRRGAVASHRRAARARAAAALLLSAARARARRVSVVPRAALLPARVVASSSGTAWRLPNERGLFVLANALRCRRPDGQRTRPIARHVPLRPTCEGHTRRPVAAAHDAALFLGEAGRQECGGKRMNALSFGLSLFGLCTSVYVVAFTHGRRYAAQQFAHRARVAERARLLAMLTFKDPPGTAPTPAPAARADSGSSSQSTSDQGPPPPRG